MTTKTWKIFWDMQCPYSKKMWEHYRYNKTKNQPTAATVLNNLLSSVEEGKSYDIHAKTKPPNSGTNPTTSSSSSSSDNGRRRLIRVRRQEQQQQQQPQQHAASPPPKLPNYAKNNPLLDLFPAAQSSRVSQPKTTTKTKKVIRKNSVLTPKAIIHHEQEAHGGRRQDFTVYITSLAHHPEAFATTNANSLMETLNGRNVMFKYFDNTATSTTNRHHLDRHTNNTTTVTSSSSSTTSTAFFGEDN